MAELIVQDLVRAFEAGWRAYCAEWFPNGDAEAAAAMTHVETIEAELLTLQGRRARAYSAVLEELNRTMPGARHRLHWLGQLARYGMIEEAPPARPASAPDALEARLVRGGIR